MLPGMRQLILQMTTRGWWHWVDRRPSGKSRERTLLNKELVEQNSARIGLENRRNVGVLPESPGEIGGILGQFLLQPLY